uniref:Uncharacterized protein n=1 Tax=Panthera tigris altaica TaxID=74533 RepID=A0A8C9JXF4_PANTA
TRVSKKLSPNCKLSMYLGKRDFADHPGQRPGYNTPESALLCHTVARPRGHKEGLWGRL